MALLGIAAVHWPVMVRAQQPGGVRTVGVFIGLAENDPLVSPRVATLRQGLAELGWIEGRNLRVHYIWGTEAEQLRQLARELIARRPDVIVAGNSAVVNALLQETRTVPIVFVTASDPVGAGFVHRREMAGIAERDRSCHDERRGHVQPGNRANGGGLLPSAA
jgi:putative ABC transport system substrate-binding protein